MVTATKPKAKETSIAREQIAYLFFDVVVKATIEGGAKMLYGAWQDLPEEIKDNYFKEADKVLELIE